ncbi:MAG: flippase activity-associated protein Agl23 [Nitrolancea sp.]
MDSAAHIAGQATYAPPDDVELGASRTRRITVEQTAYGVIFVAALLTRFWDLGSRALHHDESEHAYYSWIYAIGGGYVHDPLLHGPFLFHANALVYLLAGVSDASARYMPAATGVLIVMLPWFLRGPKLLGRWGALCASLFLLLSPSILFYSRFIRHDVYTLAGTFLLFIGIARYVESNQPRWAILAAGSIGFLTTTKEVCFIVFFIFGLFLIVSTLWRIAPILLGVWAGAGALFLVIAKALAVLGAPALPSIPWTNPTNAQVRTFAFNLITHPLVISAIGVGLLALVVSIWILDRRRDREQAWVDSLIQDVPEGSTAAAVRALLNNRRLLFVSLGIGFSIYAVLYTSLFTNMGGLASGSFGALGYWLGQQNVQRGAEPWFYYLLMLPQYEFVGIIFFPIALLFLLKDTLTGWRRHIPFDNRWWLKVLITVWAVMMFGVLSWAGEKMPWLTVHISLPLILMSAMFAGDGVAWLERHARSWRRATSQDLALFSGALVAVGLFAFLLYGWMSDGPITGVKATMARQIQPEAADHWWLLLFLPVILCAVLLVVGALRLGMKGAMVGLLLAGIVGLLLLQVHDEWRLTYREGDVPKDMLIYVQTSPDVPLVMKDLTQLSIEQTGDMSLSIWFDDITSWPFYWYIRDFTQRRFIGNQLPDTVDAPIILVGSDNVSVGMSTKLAGNYTMQEYPMRWWFPEEDTYRRFAYAPDLNDTSRQNYQDKSEPPYSILDTARSVVDTLASMRSPREQTKMFRMLAYRELPAQVHSTNFRVYIRNDLLPEYDAIRYRNGG